MRVQDIATQLTEAGVKVNTPFPIGPVPEFGLSDREMYKIKETIEIALPAAQQALARGDISMMRWELDELLKLFRINLDRNSSSYRELGIAVLKRYVSALQAIERRQKGEPVETPEVPEVGEDAPLNGETLRAAHEGWKKARRRPANSLREFAYAVDRFVELHGDMPVAKINRKHVREFREALQQLPVRRKGKLLSATLPELVEWSKQQVGSRKVSAATVNKILGAVQAVVVWARGNGFIPEEMPWADPFS